MLRKLSVLALALSVVLLPTSAVAQDATADVTIVHAVYIEDAVVDVYVGEPDDTFDPTDTDRLDAELFLADLEPGTSVGPETLPAGSYRITITLAELPEEVLFSQVVTLDAGAQLSLVAQLGLDEDAEEIEVSVFEDDLAPTACEEGRLAIRHVAIEGPVDVYVDGAIFLSGVANGEGSLDDLPAGAYDVLITGAGDETDVIVEVEGFEVTAGVFTTVYAVSLVDLVDEETADITFDLEVYDVEVGEECPEPEPEPEPEPTPEPVDEDDAGEIEQPVRVDSGTGGQAGALPVLVLLLTLLGAALVTAPLVAVRRR